jgi:acyl-coenzyme A synthetase/AMP-(fatty) acid ligase
MGTHYPFANLLAWHRDTYGLGPGVRSTAVATPGFDFSIWEAWPTLTAGGSLHLPSREVLLSAPALQRWLVDEQINVTLLPTPLAESLFALVWPGSGQLRHLHAAGDRLTVRPPAGLTCAVHNSYGPTENTAISTSGPVDAAESGGRLPDIGTPINGTAVYVLGNELGPVPPGAMGEIYLGGVGVTRGYVNRPDLTADRFVPDPFGRPGARLYRTGDLARLLPTGAIDFLGRADDQVQIRGYRIEPGEVTAALRDHEAVGDAFTMAYKEPATQRVHLVGYLVAPPGAAAPDIAAVRAHVTQLLPGYMMPTTFVVLDQLPLTRNGKVDRRALPAPRLGAPSEQRVHPAGEWERRLAEIWAQVLELDHVGVEDSFFDLGGHSLLLAEVHRRVQRDLARAVPLVTLFAHPTVRSFARYLESGADTDTLADVELAAGRRRDARDQRSRRRAARADSVEPA